MNKLKFNFNNDQPIYLQLIDQLELYIISGTFPPGERLPSVRELAIIAKVNPNTMQRALSELEDKKLIYTERTNGKFVNPDEKHIQKDREKYALAKVKQFTSEMTRLGFTPHEVIKLLKKEGDK